MTQVTFVPPALPPAAEFCCPEAGPIPDDTPAGESLFENFVDEIDVWARRALAANGFGDGM